MNALAPDLWRQAALHHAFKHTATTREWRIAVRAFQAGVKLKGRALGPYAMKHGGTEAVLRAYLKTKPT